MGMNRRRFVVARNSFRRVSRAAPMKPSRALFVFLSVWLFAAAAARAQNPAARVFTDAPAAQWIAAPDVAANAFGVFHFRHVLSLQRKPERFIVHVSADNRYRLFVNGRPIASGPQRSDLAHWRYETLDLAPFLQAGDNALTALVWN